MSQEQWPKEEVEESRFQGQEQPIGEQMIHGVPETGRWGERNRERTGFVPQNGGMHVPGQEKSAPRGIKRKKKGILKRKSQHLLTNRTRNYESTSTGPDEDEERLRGHRFTHKENEVLVQAVIQRSEDLFGTDKFKGSAARKRHFWEEVVDTVSGLGKCRRSVEVCKKRFQDCRRQVKQKMLEEENQITAGGPRVLIYYNSWEEMLRQYLSLTALSGIVDTGDTATLQPKAPSVEQTSKDDEEIVMKQEIPERQIRVQNDTKAGPSQPVDLPPKTPRMPSTDTYYIQRRKRITPPHGYDPYYYTTQQLRQISQSRKPFQSVTPMWKPKKTHSSYSSSGFYRAYRTKVAQHRPLSFHRMRHTSSTIPTTGSSAGIEDQDDLAMPTSPPRTPSPQIPEEDLLDGEDSEQEMPLFPEQQKEGNDDYEAEESPPDHYYTTDNMFEANQQSYQQNMRRVSRTRNTEMYRMRERITAMEHLLRSELHHISSGINLCHMGILDLASSSRITNTVLSEISMELRTLNHTLSRAVDLMTSPTSLSVPPVSILSPMPSCTAGSSLDSPLPPSEDNLAGSTNRLTRPASFSTSTSPSRKAKRGKNI
ncbi:uncharacterized protein WCC33_017543 [Rhinophrynus dorsalis]